MSEKKRKHRTEDNERPKKKRVVEPAAQSVKVSLVKDVGEYTPVIGMSADFQELQYSSHYDWGYRSVKKHLLMLSSINPRLKPPQ